MKTKTEQKMDELKELDPELWDGLQSYFQEMYRRMMSIIMSRYRG